MVRLFKYKVQKEVETHDLKKKMATVASQSQTRQRGTRKGWMRNSA